jgi:GDP-L-fucose synthase
MRSASPREANREKDERSVSASLWKGKRVLVTGAHGFVGRNLVPLLQSSRCHLFTPTHAEYDLLEQASVRRLLADARPEIVFHLAALSGGIMSNKKYPADFCYQNLFMNTAMLHEAWRAGVRKYITLIGGCSYPAQAPSPIAESELWNGYPQAESAPYSVAKKMNVTLAEAYRRQHGFDAIVLLPGNLYGPYDNFDLQGAHVIPATIRKLHEAKLHGREDIVAWGTGKPVRDFIYVGDACEAILQAAETYSGSEIINISSGVQTTIREVVETAAEVIGYSGRITWDATKPDGQMHKDFDVTRMHEWLGYPCRTSLRDGLTKTIEWFEANYRTARLSVPVRVADR